MCDDWTSDWPGYRPPLRKYGWTVGWTLFDIKFKLINWMDCNMSCRHWPQNGRWIEKLLGERIQLFIQSQDDGGVDPELPLATTGRRGVDVVDANGAGRRRDSVELGRDRCRRPGDSRHLTGLSLIGLDADGQQSEQDEPHTSTEHCGCSWTSVDLWGRWPSIYTNRSGLQPS